PQMETPLGRCAAFACGGLHVKRLIAQCKKMVGLLQITSSIGSRGNHRRPLLPRRLHWCRQSALLRAHERHLWSSPRKMTWRYTTNFCRNLIGSALGTLLQLCVS